MSLSFIAFHMADYQRDTMQLPLEGHGAYFLLLQHCWTHGRIPADDAARAAICKVPVVRWRKQLAPLVAGYFDENGENKRATVEIAKAEKIRLRQTMAGHRGAEKRWGKDSHGQATAKPRRSHGMAAAEPQLSHGIATLDKNISSSFSVAAREEPAVDNSATAPAAPPAGLAEKPTKSAASPELQAILARKYR